MRSSTLSLFLASFLLTLLLPLATVRGVEPGDLVLAGDPAGSEWAIEVLEFVPFEFYVVAFDLEGGVTSAEWGLIAPLAWTLTDFEFPGEAWINLGDPTNVIVGLGACLDGAGPVTLARYQGAFFASGLIQDEVFCLKAAEPSSSDPPAPGYGSCDGAFVPFGAGQGGQGIYPSGCLIVNPASSPPCAPLVQRQNLDDVLVPPGATATVPYHVVEEVLVSEGTSKTTCEHPSFAAVEFTLRFDPGVLEWAGARLPARYSEFPLEVSVAAPGEIRVLLGPHVTPLDLDLAPHELVLLDLVMGSAGGTATVDFDEVRLLNEYGTWVDLDPVSILVSDDPSVTVESESFGAIKARY